MEFTTLKRPKRGLLKRQRRRSSLLTTILAATDFSPASMAGVNYASALAEKFQSDLIFAHIVEPSPHFSGMQALVQARTDREVAERARARLANLAKTQLQDDARVSSYVGFGKAFAEIINIARRHKADLIVIATQSRTSIERAIIGSTAENVVRHARCPVLSVPIRQANRPFRLKRILVPTDFSNLSKDALPYAALIAGAFEADITLVSAVEKFPIDYVMGHELTHQTIEPMRRHAETQLKKIAESVSKRTGLNLTTGVLEGKPFEQICRAAKKYAADLIILTTHGHTGLKRMWLGSTAERVVQHAECPVLVVRELERKSSL